MPPDATATKNSVARMTSQRAASTRSANRLANCSPAVLRSTTGPAPLFVNALGGKRRARPHCNRSLAAGQQTPRPEVKNRAVPKAAELRPHAPNPAETERRSIRVLSIHGDADWRSMRGKIWPAGDALSTALRKFDRAHASPIRQAGRKSADALTFEPDPSVRGIHGQQIITEDRGCRAGNRRIPGSRQRHAPSPRQRPRAAPHLRFAHPGHRRGRRQLAEPGSGIAAADELAP